MSYQPLISVQELLPHIEEPDVAVIDCRFHLLEPERGESEYLEAHIPGAIYAHLDRDLSAPATGSNGRHPLPSVEKMVRLFAQWGIDAGVQVVAYDGDSGQIAARLWWMLRYAGHDNVAVLDGGLRAWKEAGLALGVGRQRRPSGDFQPQVRERMRVDVVQILKHVEEPASSEIGLLIDARDPKRYRGEEEPIDPVAGHIPRARNHFHQSNLDGRGRFLPSEELRRRFQSLLGETAAEAVAVYCGSGVTACHDLLAMEHAGMVGARLYPGSWSEWCADPSRPIETGEGPESKSGKQDRRT
ncbi:MAG: sulfurtransferase [Acidobacteriota bacterium]